MHTRQGGAFHNLDITLQLVVIVGRKAKAIHLPVHHVVVEPCGASHADTPLRAHERENFKGRDVVRPDVHGIRRHVVGSEAERGQLLFVRSRLVKRRGGGF